MAPELRRWSDIFISYSSADRERARQVAEALQRRGRSIWWDREIPPGRQYDDVIDEALSAARCVVVLWTKASTASSWVKNEASEAMDRRVLIPAVLDSGLEDPARVPPRPGRRFVALAGRGVDTRVRAVLRGDRRHRLGIAAGSDPAAGARAGAAATHPAGTGSTAAAAKGHGVRNALVERGSSSPRWSPCLWQRHRGSGTEGPRRSNGPGPSAGPTRGAERLHRSRPTAGAVHIDLTWRDYVLRYTGTLRWDGRSPDAQLSMRIVDGITGASLGSREPAATMHGRRNRAAWSSARRSSWPATAAPPVRTATAALPLFELQPNGRWSSSATAWHRTIAGMPEPESGVPIAATSPRSADSS